MSDQKLKSRKAEKLKCGLICTLSALAMLLLACKREAVEDVQVDLPRSVVEADGVELVVSASKREIDVGEPLRVELRVTANEGIDVTLPSFEEALGPFEVRRAERTPPIPVDGKREWQAQLELMTFDEGELELPTIEVSYRLPAGEHEEASPRPLASTPLSIVARTVVGADADPSAFRDIKGPAEMPTEPAWKWWLLGAGGAALLAVLTAAAVLLARMRREPAMERVLEPHEWALNELDALERDKLIEQRAFEPFYVRLSAVVRGYLERRFGLMAPERTTDEFLCDARRSRLLRDDHRELLGDFLRAADMVKFAKYEPMEGACRDALDSARSFVEQTVPTRAPAQRMQEAGA